VLLEIEGKKNLPPMSTSAQLGSFYFCIDITKMIKAKKRIKKIFMVQFSVSSFS